MKLVTLRTLRLPQKAANDWANALFCSNPKLFQTNSSKTDFANPRKTSRRERQPAAQASLHASVRPPFNALKNTFTFRQSTEGSHGLDRRVKVVGLHAGLEKNLRVVEVSSSRFLRSCEYLQDTFTACMRFPDLSLGPYKRHLTTKHFAELRILVMVLNRLVLAPLASWFRTSGHSQRLVSTRVLFVPLSSMVGSSRVARADF